MKSFVVLRSERDLEKALAAVNDAARADKLHQVRIQEYDPKRLLEQNDTMWAWCRVAADAAGWTVDDVKKTACAELLGMDIHQHLNLYWEEPKGTSHLGRKAFAEFLDRLAPWLIEHFNVSLEKPNHGNESE